MKQPALILIVLALLASTTDASAGRDEPFSRPERPTVQAPEPGKKDPSAAQNDGKSTKGSGGIPGDASNPSPGKPDDETLSNAPKYNDKDFNRCAAAGVFGAAGGMLAGASAGFAGIALGGLGGGLGSYAACKVAETEIPASTANCQLGAPRKSRYTTRRP